MKRLLFSFLLLLSAAWASAQTDINNVFVYMPDSLLPLLTRNDRLDLLDYHTAGYRAPLAINWWGPHNEIGRASCRERV